MDPRRTIIILLSTLLVFSFSLLFFGEIPYLLNLHKLSTEGIEKKALIVNVETRYSKHVYYVLSLKIDGEVVKSSLDINLNKGEGDIVTVLVMPSNQKLRDSKDVVIINGKRSMTDIIAYQSILGDWIWLLIFIFDFFRFIFIPIWLYKEIRREPFLGL
jgi:hypothetical protein